MDGGGGLYEYYGNLATGVGASDGTKALNEGSVADLGSIKSRAARRIGRRGSLALD